MRTTLTHLFSWMPQELCTEIRSCLALQLQLYSSYKSRTTLKDLFGISPNGSIYFVSELWNGPISDHERVIKSVMFCLSKTILSSHSQAVLPFNFFFFLLSDFLHLLLVDSHDVREQLKMNVSGSAKVAAHSFSTRLGIPSGPTAFHTFNFDKDFLTDSCATAVKEKLSGMSTLVEDTRGLPVDGGALHCTAKTELRQSALSSAEVFAAPLMQE